MNGNPLAFQHRGSIFKDAYRPPGDRQDPRRISAKHLGPKLNAAAAAGRQVVVCRIAARSPGSAARFSLPYPGPSGLKQPPVAAAPGRIGGAAAAAAVLGAPRRNRLSVRRPAAFPAGPGLPAAAVPASRRPESAIGTDGSGGCCLALREGNCRRQLRRPLGNLLLQELDCIGISPLFGIPGSRVVATTSFLRSLRCRCLSSNYDHHFLAVKTGGSYSGSQNNRDGWG